MWWASSRLWSAGPVHSQRLLVATRRRAELKALGVAAAGIDDTRPFIAVDDHLRAADGVWSVGDVTGAGAFTHVAMYQARIAASDILGQPHEPASYRALPRVTFTDPKSVPSVSPKPRHAAGMSPCGLRSPRSGPRPGAGSTARATTGSSS